MANKEHDLPNNPISWLVGILVSVIWGFIGLVMIYGSIHAYFFPIGERQPMFAAVGIILGSAIVMLMYELLQHSWKLMAEG